MMGPDEFHEKSPGQGEKGGLRDNAYTNIMLAWLLRQTMNIYFKQNLLIQNSKVVPDNKEIAKWNEISENLVV